MCTFDPDIASGTIAPHLDNSERIEYLRQEIESIKEILEEEEDCKWIYQALVECTLIILKLEGIATAEAKEDINDWISKLKRLDPLRKGRWVDLEKSFKY